MIAAKLVAFQIVQTTKTSLRAGGQREKPFSKHLEQAAKSSGRTTSSEFLLFHSKLSFFHYANSLKAAHLANAES
jgi:hypothetical protein